MIIKSTTTVKTLKGPLCLPTDVAFSLLKTKRAFGRKSFSAENPQRGAVGYPVSIEIFGPTRDLNPPHTCASQAPSPDRETARASVSPASSSYRRKLANE